MISFPVDINFEMKVSLYVFGKAAWRTQCISIQISFLFIIAFLLTWITQAVVYEHKKLHKELSWNVYDENKELEPFTHKHPLLKMFTRTLKGGWLPKIIYYEE